MKQQPLCDVRVLDLTQVFSGPYSAMTLAFLGAQVIRVESRRRANQARSRQALLNQAQRSTYTPIHAVNLGKLSLNLDLSKPEAVEIFHRMVQVCDVVVENFRPGVLDRLGVGYQELVKQNPTIILLSSSGAGSEGPEARYMGYAHGFAAMGGLSEITGYRDGPPTEFRSGMDMRVGHAIAFAALAALFHRRRTGEGQWIDLSSREVATSLIGDVIVEQSMTGKPVTRQGNQHPWMAPHNCYPCNQEDSWISIAVATDDEWRSLCSAMGKPEMASDSRFADAYSRWHHQEELDADIGQWTVDFTPFELMEKLQRVGVAAVPSYRNDDIYSDAHLQSRDFSAEVHHAEAGLEIVLGAPWKFSDSHVGVPGPAPTIGEHTDSILTELLGIGNDELTKLVETGVIP